MLNMYAMLDHSPSSFSRDLAPSQQEYELNYMLYGAVPRDFSNGEDALHQDRTVPPLTGHPVILTEYDQLFPSHLAQTSAIAPAPGIHGTRDRALDTLYLADDVGKVEPFVFPFVQQHPLASPLPAARANALDLMNGVQHWDVQNVGVHDPLPVASSASHGQGHGGPSMFTLPPHDAHSPCTDASVQIGEPMWNMNIDREILFNLGTPGESRGYQDGQTLHNSSESLSPFSNWTPPSSQGLPAGAVPTPAYPPIVPDIVDGTTANVRMIPLPPDRTVPQPGGGDTHERMDRICHAFGKMVLLSYSNEPWNQEQLCTPGTSTMSVLSTYHMDSPKTVAFFGHHGGVQNGPNYHVISQPYSPNAGPVIPAQHVPPACPGLFTGYLEPLNGGASSVATFGSSVGALATANLTNSPSEASQIHPSPTQPTTFATSGPPQQSFSDPRPCPWRDEQEVICNELVSWDCQDHLASSHGIVNISGSTLVTCGACDLQLKRESLLRHFREVDLRFRRPR
ncbi:hypothetical protein M404DRAFT_815242 [Pisolithus tinctorius Marx 270]|uniref:Uncharacterized protein n=1 Tax=Pisolithus tinctorius Marx 270 TaxID=870435 RepID=A0A0C3JP58_PISTI|nr:hypothetical protein M404DRAFT_815242 [Pisolithus tinctorius Marx 270]